MREKATYLMSQLDRDTLRWLEPESDPLAAARGVVVGSGIGLAGLLVTLAMIWLTGCTPVRAGQTPKVEAPQVSAADKQTIEIEEASNGWTIRVYATGNRAGTWIAHTQVELIEIVTKVTAEHGKSLAQQVKP